MIQFQLKINSASIAINPKTVTHVSDAGEQGCVVHYVSGHSSHLKNDYLSVVGILTAQQ